MEDLGTQASKDKYGTFESEPQVDKPKSHPSWEGCCIAESGEDKNSEKIRCEQQQQQRSLKQLKICILNTNTYLHILNSIHTYKRIFRTFHNRKRLHTLILYIHVRHITYDTIKPFEVRYHLQAY